MVKDAYQAVPATARLAGNFGGLFVGERGWVTSMYGGGPVEGGPPEIFEEMGLETARGDRRATTTTRTGSSASARGAGPARTRRSATARPPWGTWPSSPSNWAVR